MVTARVKQTDRGFGRSNPLVIDSDEPPDTERFLYPITRVKTKQSNYYGRFSNKTMYLTSSLVTAPACGRNSDFERSIWQGPRQAAAGAADELAGNRQPLALAIANTSELGKLR